ncbi:hypothetical protein [Cellulosimicrobium cellulans]|uniref:hypothetical protein n=1 Tax=Cellulosimicrobium cellulans TaxID=1710 RepID=UPI001112DE04|nr:hypothetical protein [Cellulosimicrobium cellulans]
MGELGAVAWDEDASAGQWIAGRLGGFGPRVDGTVPRGYAAYACVPGPEHDATGVVTAVTQAEDLARVLAAFTRSQPVHLALWTGHPILYDRGTDPRATSGMGVVVGGDGDEPRPTEEELAAAREEGWRRLAPTLVERPAAPMLLLPHREYHLWTGTVADVAAFRRHGQPPDLWWPRDRSWFVGAEIDSTATYVGGGDAVVNAVCAEPSLGAYRVAPSDRMLFDG